MEPYIKTYSLRRFFFLNPQPNQVRIDDIAYHLAREGRFLNGIQPHYSVAEHCVLMADYFAKAGEQNLARQALMHDCSEAYLRDLPSPIKKCLPEYMLLEKSIEAFLYVHFGLPVDLEPRIKEVDACFCITEQRVLREEELNYSGPLLNIDFQLWSWKEAKSNFLLYFALLFPEYKDVE